MQREIVATEQKLGKYETEATKTAEAINDVGRNSRDAADGTDEVSDKAKKAGKNLGDMGNGADDAADGVEDVADQSEKAGSSLGSFEKAAESAGNAGGGEEALPGCSAAA